MTLRRQLLLVSLLLLALPWAGCQFIREIEGTLRQGQVRALQATAQAIAASFADQPTLLYPWPERLQESADPARSIYAWPTASPIIVDGYADGWPTKWQGMFPRGGLPRGGLSRGGDDPGAAFRYRAATRGEQLYLLVAVTDAEVVYDNPGHSPAPNGDRLLLRTWAQGRNHDYVIATAAPGSVRARRPDRYQLDLEASRIRGAWQDTPTGYTLELVLPLALTGGRLGLMVVNESPRSAVPAVAAGNFTEDDRGAPPWLVFSPAPLTRALSAFAMPGRQLQVYDKARWQLASQGTASPGTAGPATVSHNASPATPHTFWLLRALYRRILADDDIPPLPLPGADGRLAASELEKALQGGTATRWYRDSGASPRTTLSAAAPVTDDTGTIGAVLVRQSSEEYLSLTDEAFSQLLGYSLLALALATLGLLAYATLLSWRIGRLSRAAGAVIQNGSIVMHSFPRSRARDEVGELSRRYADLLLELQAYNDYLRSLSRKLSHELRTPIAVIQSSLDNLEQDASDAEREVYVNRAREGVTRLRRILTAMTEASRVEESVRHEPLTPVDLVPLLRAVLPAYQGAYPAHRLQLVCEPEAAWTLTAPDLLVQALDKLVDNAASFAPSGAAVTLGLHTAVEGWRVSVANPGPPLPERLRGRVFEAMVSVRGDGASAHVHLGFGLYIVKLICDYLGARAEAENLPDSSGVRVSLLLRREAGSGENG